MLVTEALPLGRIFTHSFTHSCIHSRIHSFIHSFIRSIDLDGQILSSFFLCGLQSLTGSCMVHGLSAYVHTHDMAVGAGGGTASKPGEN